MKPNISEFSYGYALTEELIRGFGSAISAAPVFPSLYQEGKEGGGWDLRLAKGGIPLFLQFKLSHFMKASWANERKSGLFKKPYYRMHLRSPTNSQQHRLLLELENQGNEVYYSTPGFHEPSELNDAYLTRSVRSKSIWIKPQDIGPITDSKEHYLAFQLPKKWYFCSEPREIERNLSFSFFLEEIQGALAERRSWALTRDSLSELATNLETICAKRTDIVEDQRETAVRLLSNRHPVELVSYFASIFLDAQLMIVQ